MEEKRRIKRVNQFSRAYHIMCSQKSVKPLAAIKANLAVNRLSFCCDRVTLEDWPPILNSLAADRSLVELHVYSHHRRKKIHEAIDTQEKLDEYRRFRATTSQAPIICTNFLLRCFIDAVAVCASNSKLLTSLSLEGISLQNTNLQILCSGLTKNRNLQNLSFARCRIGNEGCAILLHAIVDNFSLRTIDLTACSLTSKSADFLTLFLKKKRVQLLESIWHQTGIPGHDETAANHGLQNLILDHNRKFGDNGFRLLAMSLKDDFWLNKLSIRSCGLTRISGEAIIELLETNSTIQSMKFRSNRIPKDIIRSVRRLLKRRQDKGERIPLKRRLLNRNKDLKRRKSSKKVQTNNRRKLKRFDSTVKNLGSKEIESLTVKSSKLMQLNDRLSNVIDCNRNLTRNLANERQMLVHEKLSRLNAERSYQLLRPVFKNLLNGVEEEDKIRGKVVRERDICTDICKIFNQLESISVKNANVANELPLKNVEIAEKNPIIKKSAINYSDKKQRTIKGSQKRPNCPPRQHN